jgi:pimeloyl-ACP methyl ester carboxylesterase
MHPSVYGAQPRPPTRDLLDVSVEQLRTIAQPTLVLAGKESPPALAEVASLVAAAIPEARITWVEGGHLIDPAHPAVLALVDEMLGHGVAVPA